jgi:pyridoxal phosphate enzyme (YggS family)
MGVFENIRDNIIMINKRIAEAASRVNKHPKDIKLVAVTKTCPLEAIKAAAESGIQDFGESRLQEAEPKIDKLGHIADWHMIGHLQSNKTKRAVAIFDMIQSLDSWKLAEEINRHSEYLGKKTKCLLEINSSGEFSKFGIDPEKGSEIADKIGDLRSIELCGLMTIGPLSNDMNSIRRAFEQTKKLYDNIQNRINGQFRILSMGMSSDFEIAIAEGSNMVRVGTAIFGDRTL